MKGKDEVTTHSVSFIVPDNRRLDEICKMLEAQGVKNLTITEIEDKDSEEDEDTH
jgi:hypothetical protein